MLHKIPLANNPVRPITALIPNPIQYCMYFGSYTNHMIWTCKTQTYLHSQKLIPLHQVNNENLMNIYQYTGNSCTHNSTSPTCTVVYTHHTSQFSLFGRWKNKFNGWKSPFVFSSQSFPYIQNDLHPTLSWLTFCGQRTSKQQIILPEKPRFVCYTLCENAWGKVINIVLWVAFMLLQSRQTELNSVMIKNWNVRGA